MGSGEFRRPNSLIVRWPDLSSRIAFVSAFNLCRNAERGRLLTSFGDSLRRVAGRSFRPIDVRRQPLGRGYLIQAVELGRLLVQLGRRPPRYNHPDPTWPAFESGLPWQSDKAFATTLGLLSVR
jgi:hypothetical protein